MESLRVFLLVLILYKVQSRALDTNETVEDKCIKDLGLDDEVIQNTIRESYTTDDDKNYGKFYVCMWKGRGVMDNDGTVVPCRMERFIKEVVLNPELPVEARNVIISEISKRCKNVKGETEGQTAVRLKNCVVHRLKELHNQYLTANREM